ncbi:hypothetical protein BOX15_Mlig004310g1 [Macrostomum lignano]|uniref:Uncharacterized protein n=1 Tax=Macrostomum lignano TaxID=282301 RepID=A0A267DTY0_9PLAT|nr:hypothetical protein BOX15_Mlig004310g1 [Macrostomum lignano]
MPASPISELYRQMRVAMLKAGDLLSEYEPMAASLRRGEDSYNLAHVSELRMQIRQLLDQIDAVSLRIASLSARAQTPDPDEASDNTAGLQKQLRQQQLAKEARVERAIRAYAVAFVREGLLIVACLPTPDQLRELRAQRAEQQRREAEARRAAAAAKEQQQRSRAAPRQRRLRHRLRRAPSWRPRRVADQQRPSGPARTKKRRTRCSSRLATCATSSTRPGRPAALTRFARWRPTWLSCWPSCTPGRRRSGDRRTPLPTSRRPRRRRRRRGIPSNRKFA